MKLQKIAHFLLVSAALLVLDRVPPAQCTNDDGHEENDTSAEAPLFAPDSQTFLALLGTLAPGGADPDYFRTMIPPGETLEMVVDAFIAPLFLMEIFDDSSCAQPIASGPAPGLLRAVNTGTTVQEYWMGVRHNPNERPFFCENYALILCSFIDPCPGLQPDGFEPNDDLPSAAPLPPGIYTDLNVQAGEADYYLIPVPQRSMPGRETTVVRNESLTAQNYTLNLGIDGQQFDPDAPCAEYDLERRRHDQPIGTSFCPAVPNSTGDIARIDAYGSSVVGDGELAFLVTGLPTFSPGIVFYGPTQVQLPLGDGLRCVGGGLTRLHPVQFSGLRRYIFHVLDFDSPPFSQDFVPGSTWHFQGWFRDGSSSNLSDAVTIQFQ